VVSNKKQLFPAMADHKTRKRKSANRHRKFIKICFRVMIFLVSALTCRSLPPCGVAIFDCPEGVQPRK
jgi:hypothetical protein